MSQQLRYFNHLVIINLKASYQGKFAELNILSRLGQGAELLDEIEHCKNMIAKIDEWHDLIKQGLLIFFSDDNSSEVLQMSNQAMQCLEYIAQDAYSLAPKVKQILASNEPHPVFAETVTLIASYGRYAYTVENFLIEQGEYLKATQGNIDLKFSELQTAASEEIEMVQNFLTGAEVIETQNLRYYELLRFHCRILPGFFRAAQHEANLLSKSPKSFFSFKDAKFLKIEAETWEREQFNATEAGYWRSYDIGAEEARAWMQLNVSQPLEAARWTTAGFTPITAKTWIDVLFTPILALTWASAGFSPRESALFVRKGVYTPEQVPEENAGLILSQSMEELIEISITFKK
jgi:hypothetical protein